MCLPNVSGDTPSPIAHSSRVNLATFSAPAQYASIADLKVPTCLSDYLDNATTRHDRAGREREREREREAVRHQRRAGNPYPLPPRIAKNILTIPTKGSNYPSLTTSSPPFRGNCETIFAYFRNKQGIHFLVSVTPNSQLQSRSGRQSSCVNVLLLVLQRAGFPQLPSSSSQCRVTHWEFRYPQMRRLRLSWLLSHAIRSALE
jgi:hypothetical protein